jgi:hypothetical protein
MGYAVLLGSYNFMLLFALVPAAAVVGLDVLIKRAWSRAALWAGAMLAPLALAGMIFWERGAGLLERFQLFETYDFGWRIPLLTPEGWLGLVQGPDLSPWSWLGVRWVLTTLTLGLIGWTFVRRPRGIPLIAALLLPVLVGYGYLEWQGTALNSNASYRAYKLFAVFFPELLAAACWWITLRRGSKRLVEWAAVYAMGGFVVAGNLAGVALFTWHLAQPPLLVAGELKQLRRIEAMTDVSSVNLRIPDMWSRLWANAFLLRKPQYFPTHTYEGRLNTPLRGDWDLESGLIAVKPPGDARRQISPHYALVDTRSPQYIRAAVADGWHQEEFDRKTGDRWQWTNGDATIRVENPHDQPRTIVCTVDGWSLGMERGMALVDARGVVSTPVRIGTDRARVRLGSVVVPPGVSMLTLRSPQPSLAAGPGDARKVGMCVFTVELDVQPA